jgi:uncharacterized Zn finger protein
MGRYYNHWPEYKPVSKRKADCERAVARLRKRKQSVSPVLIDGSKISKSVWGQAWCKHLESLSDYESRLPGGRSYVRHGAVIDLQVTGGKIVASVQGSCRYKVVINISRVNEEKWQGILKECSSKIVSVIELLQGHLSSGVMKIITDRERGLFPLPKEISLKCSCPDWVGMCKHVAATLYGVGARLDHEPELLFLLRGVNHLDLIANATTHVARIEGRGAINDDDIAGIFGIDVEEVSDEPETPKQTNPNKSKPYGETPKKKQASDRKKTALKKPPLKKKTTKKRGAR